jgi:hypothetical protein
MPAFLAIQGSIFGAFMLLLLVFSVGEPLAVMTALQAESFVHCNIFMVSILLGFPVRVGKSF